VGEPVADTVIWPVMVSLAECLCTQITSSGLPEPCFCGVLPGNDVAYDYCDGCEDGTCGQAWVRMAEAFPARVFPVPDSDRGNCATALAVELVVGIVRCAPMPDEHGDPPTMEAQFDTAQLVVADMMAMRRAIMCCTQAYRGRDYLLGPYLPIGPEGGCVGGAWTVTFSE